MTNGEKIQAILDIDTDCTEVYGKNGIMTFSVPQDWWNAEYKEPSSSGKPTSSTTKNDLGVRKFEEIIVEYPPEDLCTYPEYKGKPYFNIKYKEGNDYIIGFGTYSPKVLSRYLTDYFIPSVTPQEPRWIPVSEKYPKIEDEYKYFLVTDDKGKVSVQEFFISLDEEPQPYFSGMVNVIAWMPLPLPYKAESEEI